MTEIFQGLTSGEVQERLGQYGPNILPEEKTHPLLMFLQKFWAPVSWMLELIIVLELAFGKYPEALIIFFLLIFNAAMSFAQEDKANRALLLLKDKLNIRVRVLRDREWSFLPAQELVPGDIIRIRMGDIIPADVELLSGHLSIDQSSLTGESLPVEAEQGMKGYASSIVKLGEAFARVSATGKNTYFGKTAEILSTAKTPSHLESIIFRIIKFLLIFDAVLVLFVFIYSSSQGLPIKDLLLFSLLILVASVPVALPATFTLATALGSQELARRGILVTRLSAIEEAAAMSILCVDKTGTITKNVLDVSSLRAYSPYTEEDLLALASVACEEATQDPLDLAILRAAKNSQSPFCEGTKTSFIPFDPEKKYAEGILRFQNRELRILKGAPTELLKNLPQEFSQEGDKLEEDGSRVLAVVASGSLVGFIALQDLPREDAEESLAEIRNLGIRVIMITGDAATTARSIAKKIGMGTTVLTREDVFQKPPSEMAKADIIAGVFPEDKFHIISSLQKLGFICGMTGDGVNDAPALKKAEVGIAVSSAMDVAKASASLVLTKPGLIEIIAAVKTSRRIYQRMLTYTMNKIIKTLQIAVLLGLGLVLTNNFIISTLLIVLLLFANDFVTMSLATDNVSYSQKPDKWNIRHLSFLSAIFAACMIIFSFFVLFFGQEVVGMSLPEIRTLIFLTLIFTGQAIVYLVRERGHFWHSRPSRWLIASSIADILIVCALALYGIFMAPLSAYLIFGLLGSIILYFLLLDRFKVSIIKRLRYGLQTE